MTRLLTAFLLPALLCAESAGAAGFFRVKNHSPESAPVAFAVGELREYLAATTSGGNSGNDSTPRVQIAIGLRADLPDEYARRLPESKEGFDGYAVAITTTDAGMPLWIIGGDNDRGVVYGAYDVLEHVGWRWFHPHLDPKDPEVRPTTTELKLAKGRWAVASPMKTRALIWYVSLGRIRTNPPPPEHLRKQIDWAMKSRYNSLEYRAIESEADDPLRKTLTDETDRRGMLLQAPGHNFDLFLPNDEKLFQEHPEWFGEERGVRRRHSSRVGRQFCWTNEEAMGAFITNATAFVKARPELDTLTMSALDGGQALPCGCERCSQQPTTDRYLQLLNRLTESLATTAPHVTVEAIVGYQHVAEPPEKVEPHEKLRGRYAAWRRSASDGYDNDPAGPKLAEWSNIFDHRLTAFQYYSDHYAGAPLAPPLTRLIKADREFLLKTGSDGFLNLLYLEGYWWRQTLNGYLAGRSFYDPELDPDELLADYATRYHGKDTARFMVPYYTRLAEVPQIGTRAWGNAKPKHQRFLTQMRNQHLAPAETIVAEDPVLSYRLHKAQSWHRVAEAAATAGAQTRLARVSDRRGKKSASEEFLKNAAKKFEKAHALASEIAAPDDGILARSFPKSYRLRFKRVLTSVQRKIEPVRTPAPVGYEPTPTP